MRCELAVPSMAVHVNRDAATGALRTVPTAIAFAGKVPYSWVVASNWKDSAAMTASNAAWRVALLSPGICSSGPLPAPLAPGAAAAPPQAATAITINRPIARAGTPDRMWKVIGRTP
jgi:hypothetical protein